MLLGALAAAATSMTLGAQPPPPPRYSNTVHFLLDAPGFYGTAADLAADAGQISALPSGPYARLGVYGYVCRHRAQRRACVGDAEPPMGA